MACDSGLITGMGTELFIGDGTNWNKISEIKNLDILQLTKEFVETTSINSVEGWLEFEPTFKSAGELSVSMNYNVAGFNLLLDQFELNEMSYWKIVIPDKVSTTILFKADISKFPIKTGVGEIISMDISLKLTGKPDIDIPPLAPVITLNGASLVEQYQYVDYSDAGATAMDAVDGDISSDIVVTGTVNKDVPGTYYIKYNVTNSFGIPASEVIRTVIVVRVYKIIGKWNTSDPLYAPARTLAEWNSMLGLDDGENGTALVYLDIVDNGSDIETFTVHAPVADITWSGVFTHSNHVLEFIDEGAIIHGQHNCFSWCWIQKLILPEIISIDEQALKQSTMLSEVSIPKCVNIGKTIGNDNVFDGINGNAIALTIPASVRTDEDIVWLEANNTVTVTET